MSDKFVSFYFDTSLQPFTYGACVWSGSYETETHTVMVPVCNGTISQPRYSHTIDTPTAEAGGILGSAKSLA
jgi:hypothetical protein